MFDLTVDNTDMLKCLSCGVALFHHIDIKAGVLIKKCQEYID